MSLHLPNATANTITHKPYGLLIQNLSQGVITIDNVEVSTIAYFPAAGATTTAAIVLSDNNHDIFWQYAAGVSLNSIGVTTDFMTGGMRVEGIRVETAPSDTNSTLLIKLK